MHKELIGEADEEGISLNQYLIYIISKGMRSGYDIKTQQKSNL